MRLPVTGGMFDAVRTVTHSWKAMACSRRSSGVDSDRCAIAAVSISGPVERVSRQPGRLHAATVVAGANKLTEVLARAAAQQKSVAPPTTR